MFNKDAILAQAIEIECPGCANEFRKTLGELISKDFITLNCNCRSISGSTHDTRELKRKFEAFVDEVNRFQNVSVLREAVRRL
jgi:thiamine biosynthesis lipoprotein ApbE